MSDSRKEVLKPADIDWINEELRCEEGIRRMAAALSDRLKEKRGHSRHGWHDSEVYPMKTLLLDLVKHLGYVTEPAAVSLYNHSDIDDDIPLDSIHLLISEKDVIDALALLMFYWNRVYGKPKTFGPCKGEAA